MKKMECINTDSIVSEVINRWLCCAGYNQIYSYGGFYTLLVDIAPVVKVIEIKTLKKTGGLLCVNISRNSDWECITNIIGQGEDIVLFVDDSIEIPIEYSDTIRNVYSKQRILNGTFYFYGKCWNVRDAEIVDDFKVLAIVHFYNEEDIIEKTINYLLDQGLHLYLVDNWSTDSSFNIATLYKNKYPDRIYLEHFPEEPSCDYMWYEQLKKTEDISKELEYNWYIHYDCDEIRKSPWEGVRLREAIAYIDSLGYNCIENTVIDFRITDYNDDIFGNGKFFDFRYDYHWIDQLKTWKKSDYIDLKSSGGHYAKVLEPKIYPLKFLNCHYPLRSITQAKKKIFVDRIPRFEMEKKMRGWHGHYDLIKSTRDFLYNREDLYTWNNKTYEDLYVTLHTECGIIKKKPTEEWYVPEFYEKRIVIYGAGKAGRGIYPLVTKNNYVVAWVDRDYRYYPNIYCEIINNPELLNGFSMDVVIVAVVAENLQKEIISFLKQKGIDINKIYCIKPLDK